MKRIIQTIFLLCMALAVHAQQDSTAAHLKFMGMPIEGNITDFTQAVRQKYKLKKKVGDENYYIYTGPFMGHEVYLKVEYTRKSRTAYRVTVTPKNIDQTALADSMVANYGQPYEIQGGYRWNSTEGDILLLLPQGYDPIVMYIDAQGLETLKKEK